ncbi:DNA-formamidopyrimidine glycosylase [Capnocytophaga sp. oral taxon 338 str. F0234]|nr:DNA-formamidopyrimidine glycosylase [Capnocytophaga sp. oral taxon 338 str. F0234]
MILTLYNNSFSLIILYKNLTFFIYEYYLLFQKIFIPLHRNNKEYIYSSFDKLV